MFGGHCRTRSALHFRDTDRHVAGDLPVNGLDLNIKLGRRGTLLFSSVRARLQRKGVRNSTANIPGRWTAAA
jgi:hypothetical protein